MIINRISLKAIEVDVLELFSTAKDIKGFPQEVLAFEANVSRLCILYVARRKGYTLKQIGEVVGGSKSTIFKNFQLADRAIRGGESPLKTCLSICKQRLSC